MATYEELLNDTNLDLNGKRLVIHFETVAYQKVYQGNQVFLVDEVDGELEIAPEDDSRGLVAYTDNGKVFIYIRPQTAYEDYKWLSYDLQSDNKSIEILKAFRDFAMREYTFGGWHPYIEALEGVDVKEPEPKAIGEAEIGVNFIIN